jgi:hypothetical protein
MSMQLQEVSLDKISRGQRQVTSPASLRDNFPKYGKVNVTETNGVLTIIVRYHNHVIAAYQSPGELGEGVRDKIKAAITKRIQKASNADAQKYVDALHKSQREARKNRKK